MDGIVTVDAEEMGRAVMDYFQSILASDTMPYLSTTLQWFRDLQPFRCSYALQDHMISYPTDVGIVMVLTKLNPNKTAGPDGLTSAFYKAAWPVLGQEFLNAVKMFFVT